MANQRGLQVTVKGDLPEEVLSKISNAVQRAVRDEVAKIDLLRDYREGQPKDLATDKPVMGLVYIPPHEQGS
jgi:hypothetical protein